MDDFASLEQLSGTGEEAIDILKAQEILDEDHYDLVKIKERILEHLGVMKLNPNAKAPILCFVGPPGVGKNVAGAIHRPIAESQVSSG